MGNENNGQSNETLENVEKFDFEGHEVNFMIEDGKAKVEMPEGLTEEEEEKFKKTVPSLIASLNKKNLDVKKELTEKEKELQLMEERLKLDREILEQQRSQAYKPEQPSNPLKDCFGVDSWEEVAEMQVSNPAKHAEGMAKYSMFNAMQYLQPSVTENVVRQTIISQGVNIADVESLQRHYGMNSLQKAWDLYKQINQEKPKVDNKNLRASVQAEAVEIMPKGQTINKRQLSEDEKVKKLQQEFLSAR